MESSVSTTPQRTLWKKIGFDKSQNESSCVRRRDADKTYENVVKRLPHSHRVENVIVLAETANIRAITSRRNQNHCKFSNFDKNVKFCSFL